MKKHKPIAIILIIAFISHGCGAATVGVRTIGAKVKWGEVGKNNNNDDDNDIVTMTLKDSEMYMNVGHSGFAYRAIRDDGVLLGNIQVDTSKIKWNDNKGYYKTGEYEAEIGGEKILFDVKVERDLKDENKCKLRLEHKYRSAYGYPAQTLLVVTVPFDVALITITAAAVIVTAPIWLTVSLLND